VTEIQAEEHQL